MQRIICSRTWLIACSILTMISNVGCKKLVEVNSPYTSTNAVNVYASDATAAAVLTGVYSKLSSLPPGGIGLQGLSLYAGASADEFTLATGFGSPTQIACYQNKLLSTTPVDIWTYIYPFIYDVNAALDGVTNSPYLSSAAKSQLQGEALFMRAFFYFYMVNLYGDVPLTLSTDYTKTALVPRTPKAQVYQQIIQDLKTAQGLLSANYVDASVTATTTERTRPNRWVATALLARVYLYTGDYNDAATQATAVINNTSLYNLNTLANAFLKNNTEAIWQWQPVNSGYNTADARLFIITSTGPGGAQPFFISNSLLTSFEPGDNRRSSWVGSVTTGGKTYYFPYKYKVNTLNASITTTSTSMTEYTMVIRLAEMFLIRAEAEANGAAGGLDAAIADLNIIRKRAVLPVYSGAKDQATVSAAILHERQIELFSEWGHRWFDIKRTGNADAVMGGLSGACQNKGGSWQSAWQLYPIFSVELQRNPDLTQNPGY
jgi:hypothetical protein